MKKVAFYKANANVWWGAAVNIRTMQMGEAAVPIYRQWVEVLKGTSVAVEGAGKTSLSTSLKVVLLVLVMIVAVFALAIGAAAILAPPLR